MSNETTTGQDSTRRGQHDVRTHQPHRPRRDAREQDAGSARDVAHELAPELAHDSADDASISPRDQAINTYFDALVVGDRAAARAAARDVARFPGASREVSLMKDAFAGLAAQPSRFPRLGLGQASCPDLTRAVLATLEDRGTILKPRTRRRVTAGRVALAFAAVAAVASVALIQSRLHDAARPARTLALDSSRSPASDAPRGTHVAPGMNRPGFVDPDAPSAFDTPGYDPLGSSERRSDTGALALGDTRAYEDSRVAQASPAAAEPRTAIASSRGSFPAARLMPPLRTEPPLATVVARSGALDMEFPRVGAYATALAPGLPSALAHDTRPAPITGGVFEHALVSSSLAQPYSPQWQGPLATYAHSRELAALLSPIAPDAITRDRAATSPMLDLAMPPASGFPHGRRSLLWWPLPTAPLTQPEATPGK
jgi:hypothetical protein